MIKELNKTDMRDSAVIYKSSLERIRAMMENGMRDLAYEYAISVIETALTGQCSSDDFNIQMYLKDFNIQAQRNKDKHDLAVVARGEKKIKDQRLDEIAQLYNEGKTQADISRILNISKQTISNRVKLIRTNFSFLLDNNIGQKSQESSQSQVNLLDESQTFCQSQEKNLDKSLGQVSSKVSEVKKKSLTNEDNSLDSNSCQASQVSQMYVNVNVNENVNKDNFDSTSSYKDCPLVSLQELYQLRVNFEWLNEETVKIKDTGKIFRINGGYSND